MSQALYYPWIDVRDEAWLKTALLYWDSVRTIVPESIDPPDSTDTGRALQDAEFLVPLRVHSGTMDPSRRSVGRSRPRHSSGAPSRGGCRASARVLDGPLGLAAARDRLAGSCSGSSAHTERPRPGGRRGSR
jgi:hypothetical protein